MDDFARRAAADREAFLRETAERMSISPLLVEKDFWVCWVLRQVFTLEEHPAVVFKGGTSLSKCYRVIERFSEDIDLGFDRRWFGVESKDFVGSQTKQQKAVDKLRSDCFAHVSGPYREALHQRFESALAGQHFTLELHDDGEPTLLFEYPKSLQSADYGALTYVKPVVRLELGARSDQEPAESLEIQPYVSTVDAGVTGCRVQALAIERTFWEKSTILHAAAHDERRLRARISRHYYDTAMIWRKYRDRVTARLDLLEQVAKHKELFFLEKRASYHTACPGTLRLVPDADKLEELERDYAPMQELLFGDPPSFEEILATLREIEAVVNR